MKEFKTHFRSALAAIVGALILTLFGMQQASAEFVENVDCGSDKEVQAAIEKCFEEKLKDCPEANKVAAGCRNNKQYCTCTKKKVEPEDADEKEKRDTDKERKKDPDKRAR